MAHAHTPNPNNKLSAETSPYLLQHQDNPVDWWAWGPAALYEAPDPTWVAAPLVEWRQIG